MSASFQIETSRLCGHRIRYKPTDGFLKQFEGTGLSNEIIVGTAEQIVDIIECDAVGHFGPNAPTTKLFKYLHRKIGKKFLIHVYVISGEN